MNKSTYFLPQEKYDEIRQKYPKFNEPWTEEEISSIIDYSLQHKKTKEMSELLGRSPKSVRLKMMELGLYKKRTREWTPEEDLKLIELYKLPCGLVTLSNTFDTTIDAVIRRLILLRMDIFYDIESPFDDEPPCL